MIESITIRVGDAQHPHDIAVPCGSILLVVGPNNSGKSLLLREIENMVRGALHPAQAKLVQWCEVGWPTLDEFEAALSELKVPENAGQPVVEGYDVIRVATPGAGHEQVQIFSGHIRRSIKTKTEQKHVVNNWMRLFLLRLDGRTRFALTSPVPAADLQSPPNTHIQALFSNDARRAAVSRIVRETFGLYFVIDPTAMKELRIRLSQSAPSPEIEQGLSAQSRAFHQAAMDIKEFGDGIQAFIGIVAGAYSGRYKGLLVDEPEAFLHPPIARKLGLELCKLAQERGGNIIAATHSSDFALGCIASGAPLTILRLEYSRGVARAKVISGDSLRGLLQKPIVRSSQVLSGLFADGVVLVESDGDRTLYEEIYRRIWEFQSKAPHVLFVNGRGKGSLKDVVAPLRALGVPAAVVVDMDVLEDGRGELGPLLQAVNMPTAAIQPWTTMRAKVASEYRKQTLVMKKAGLQSLKGEGRELANMVIKNLADFGLFVVPCGELENWLPELMVTGDKDQFVIRMMEKLQEANVKPRLEDGDPQNAWTFVNSILEWIAKPERQGVTTD